MSESRLNAEKLNAVLAEHKNRFLIQHGMAADEYSKTFDLFVSLIMDINEQMKQLQISNKAMENELAVLRKSANMDK